MKEYPKYVLFDDDNNVSNMTNSPTEASNFIKEMKAGYTIVLYDKKIREELREIEIDWNRVEKVMKILGWVPFLRVCFNIAKKNNLV